MKRGRGIGMVVLAGALMLSAGCMGTKVQYGDATSAEPLSTDFGSSDLQQIAATMVDSFLAAPAVVRMTASQQPVLLVDRVKNKSMQHIDTESVTDSIRTKLIQSGKFRFLDRTTDQAALDEFNAARNGMVDPDRAAPMGMQYGADYILTASLAQIEQQAGNKTDVYYKFTMNLKNMRTGLLDWADEKEIRKVATRTWLGR